MISLKNTILAALIYTLSLSGLMQAATLLDAEKILNIAFKNTVRIEQEVLKSIIQEKVEKRAKEDIEALQKMLLDAKQTLIKRSENYFLGNKGFKLFGDITAGIGGGAALMTGYVGLFISLFALSELKYAEDLETAKPLLGISIAGIAIPELLYRLVLKYCTILDNAMGKRETRALNIEIINELVTFLECQKVHRQFNHYW